MIIPSALMGVTDYVYVAGVAANPDSITAVLYRWVGSTRSASGITVSVAAIGSGEYRFTWTNDSGFARTDELELVALPVVSGVTYPATVWRSHGDVSASGGGVNLSQINASETAAANLAKSAAAIVTCTASGTPTTTSIPTSAISPTPSASVADQFKGRIIIFLRDTTTVALRGQATDITASSASATPTFTVTALSAAPASGDTFVIV